MCWTEGCAGLRGCAEGCAEECAGLRGVLSMAAMLSGLCRGSLCVGGLGVASFLVSNMDKADSECETKGLCDSGCSLRNLSAVLMPSPQQIWHGRLFCVTAQ